MHLQLRRTGQRHRFHALPSGRVAFHRPHLRSINAVHERVMSWTTPVPPSALLNRRGLLCRIDQSIGISKP